MILLAALTLPAAAEDCESYEFGIREISKYGNVELDCSGTEFAALGFEYGDIITVGMHGYTVEMPIGSNYSDLQLLRHPEQRRAL